MTVKHKRFIETTQVSTFAELALFLAHFYKIK